MRFSYVRTLPLGLAIAGLAQAQSMRPEQIKQLSALYAPVLSAQRYVEGVSEACGQSPARIAALWNERNARAVARANELRAAVRRELATLAGSRSAAALEQRQDAYLDAKVASATEGIEALSSERKRHFCEKFEESVEKGQRDVVVPEAKALVHIPLQEADVVVDVSASSNGWRFHLTYKDGAIHHVEHVLLVPRGEILRFSVQSTDVIHSLRFIDAEIRSIDALPGGKRERNLIFEKTGTFTAGCGEPHKGADQALIEVKVVERDEFAEWLRSKRAAL